jgi:predicted N-acetyltransferase YhbS
MKIAIRTIEKQDYEQAHALQCEYLDGESFAEFEERVQANPDLYVVAADGGDIVGVCYGHPSKRTAASVNLQGIAVNLDDKKPYARAGIGSKLIHAFERAVKERGGYGTIGIGSADDPKVETFYLKNGYHPMELVAKNALYEELARVRVDDYESGNATREALRRKYDAQEVIYIFEKAVE